MEDQNKLLERFAKLMEEQTEEPSKKEVAAVVTKFYAQQKKTKKVNGADANEKKATRPPSAYNIFFKEQMAILKESEVDKEKEDRMSAGAKMTHIAELWKAKKEEKFETAPEEPEDAVESEPEPEPKQQAAKSKYVAKGGTRGGGRGGGQAKR
jgi:hypothetical protein